MYWAASALMGGNVLHEESLRSGVGRDSKSAPNRLSGLPTDPNKTVD